MNIADLLHDAVDGIEPADRIDELRARTASTERAAARPWFYAAGATVLATAAAVTAFAVLGDDSPSSDPGPSHHSHAQETFLVPAYFIGDTPTGQRLYREYDEVTGDDALNAALDRIQQPPNDPDYRTAWPESAFESAKVNGDTIDVQAGPAEWDVTNLAFQQLVYTLQGVVGERLPVRVLSEVTGEPVLRHEADPQTEVLSQVMINDPIEGLEVHDTFIAHGAANSFESNVPWEIRDGDTVVREGFATATGWMDKLYPWEAEVDVSDLEPGTYTFVAMTSDPSGGTEGFGPYSDTRTIVVR